MLSIEEREAWERERVSNVVSKLQQQVIDLKDWKKEAHLYLSYIYSQPCPKDTNGDGDCGAYACPYCGKELKKLLER